MIEGGTTSTIPDATDRAALIAIDTTGRPARLRELLASPEAGPVTCRDDDGPGVVCT